ncbi:hypothetical protein, conserved [Eimeria necatrix]|uniref:Uncharacterized protein n=1 Tax=Eimeria necatrix TaxID=51315 RepID=U6N4D7_9EIME|nr:hypothetical protein, conserved [Eimeria necatrix]CDJ70154.1 hypothetical protein, conserved [Eimeria necatrix]
MAAAEADAATGAATVAALLQPGQQHSQKAGGLTMGQKLQQPLLLLRQLQRLRQSQPQQPHEPAEGIEGGAVADVAHQHLLQQLQELQQEQQRQLQQQLQQHQVQQHQLQQQEQQETHQGLRHQLLQQVLQPHGDDLDQQILLQQRILREQQQQLLQLRSSGLGNNMGAAPLKPDPLVLQLQQQLLQQQRLTPTPQQLAVQCSNLQQQVLLLQQALQSSSKETLAGLKGTLQQQQQRLQLLLFQRLQQLQPQRQQMPTFPVGEITSGIAAPVQQQQTLGLSLAQPEPWAFASDSQQQQQLPKRERRGALRGPQLQLPAAELRSRNGKRHMKHQGGEKWDAAAAAAAAAEAAAEAAAAAAAVSTVEAAPGKRRRIPSAKALAAAADAAAVAAAATAAARAADSSYRPHPKWEWVSQQQERQLQQTQQQQRPRQQRQRHVAPPEQFPTIPTSRQAQLAAQHEEKLRLHQQQLLLQEEQERQQVQRAQTKRETFQQKLQQQSQHQQKHHVYAHPLWRRLQQLCELPALRVLLQTAADQQQQQIFAAGAGLARADCLIDTLAEAYHKSLRLLAQHGVLLLCEAGSNSRKTAAAAAAAAATSSSSSVIYTRHVPAACSAIRTEANSRDPCPAAEAAAAVTATAAGNGCENGKRGRREASGLLLQHGLLLLAADRQVDSPEQLLEQPLDSEVLQFPCGAHLQLLPCCNGGDSESCRSGSSTNDSSSNGNRDNSTDEMIGVISLAWCAPGAVRELLQAVLCAAACMVLAASSNSSSSSSCCGTDELRGVYCCTGDAAQQQQQQLISAVLKSLGAVPSGPPPCAATNWKGDGSSKWLYLEGAVLADRQRLLQQQLHVSPGIVHKTLDTCSLLRDGIQVYRNVVPLEEIAVVGRLVHAHFALLMDRVLQQQQHQHWPYQQSSIFKYDGIACRNSPLRVDVNVSEPHLEYGQGPLREMHTLLRNKLRLLVQRVAAAMAVDFCSWEKAVVRRQHRHEQLEQQQQDGLRIERDKRELQRNSGGSTTASTATELDDDDTPRAAAAGTAQAGAATPTAHSGEVTSPCMSAARGPSWNAGSDCPTFSTVKLEGSAAEPSIPATAEAQEVQAEPAWQQVTCGYLMSLGPHENNQKIHYDYHEEAHKRNIVSAFIPLVNLTSSNSPTTFFIGSHPVFSNAQAGDLVIMDNIVRHRGSSHSAASLRPLIYMSLVDRRFCGGEKVGSKTHFLNWQQYPHIPQQQQQQALEKEPKGKAGAEGEVNTPTDATLCEEAPSTAGEENPSQPPSDGEASSGPAEAARSHLKQQQQEEDEECVLDLTEAEAAATNLEELCAINTIDPLQLLQPETQQQQEQVKCCERIAARGESPAKIRVSLHRMQRHLQRMLLYRYMVYKQQQTALQDV